MPGALPRYRLFCATWTEFHERSGLDDLPQTRRSAQELGRALRELGALAGEPVHVDGTGGAACITAIEDFLGEATDDVIFYLASHGLVSGRGHPYRLATNETRSSDDLTRTLPVPEITERLARHDAARKVLIVDACYSGRVGGKLYDQAFGPDTDPAGIYLLASSGPFRASIAPADQELTAFVANLVDVLRAGLPKQPRKVSLQQLFEAVKQRTADEVPAPMSFDQNGSAGALLFRNAATDGDGEAPPGPIDGGALDHYRAEILYVDDQAAYLKTFKRQLEEAGHRVTTALNAREAARKLRAAYFDLIVLDLLDAGLAPAKDLIRTCTQNAPHSEIYLASRQGTQANAAENWKELGGILAYPSRIAAFLWKPAYTTEITRRADEIREQRRRVLAQVPNLEDAVPLIAGRMIRRDAELADLSESLQAQARITVERLVAKWLGPTDGRSVFVESMWLRPVDSGRSACSIFKVEPRLHGVAARHTMPMILKIGPESEISQEVKRYDRFVQVGVPLDLRTDKIGSAGVGRVGGILYSFRGGRDGELAEVGQLGAEEIARCLDSVFDSRSSRRWSAARGTTKVQPVEYFAKTLGYCEFKVATDVLRTSVEQMLPDGADGPAPTIEPVYESHIAIEHHDTTLVHGDLNLSNLVRCGEKRYALIDYRTVGLGPRLIDFATVEVACWLTAPAPTESRNDLFADARTAIGPVFDDRRGDDEIPEWLVSSRQLALQCRRLACENHDDATGLEYATLLWLAAVRRSSFRSGVTSAAERRALRVIPAALALAAQAMIEAEDEPA